MSFGQRKMIIIDKWLGYRRIGEHAVDIIRDKLNLVNAILRYHENNDKYLRHIKYEKKIYEYILNSGSPERNAERYIGMGKSIQLVKRSKKPRKQDIIKRLKWKI